MAFWKKSDDPWDIDPEKRKKQSTTTWWEQEAPAETEPSAQLVGERLGDALKGFLGKKEDEEPIPPEKCPWCGKDMEWGCITGGRDSVTWKNWKPKGLGLMRPAGWKELDLLDEGEWAPYKTVWNCRDCGKMVLEVQNPRNADEVEEAYHKPASYEQQLNAWGANPTAYEDYQSQWGGEKKEET